MRLYIIFYGKWALGLRFRFSSVKSAFLNKHCATKCQTQQLAELASQLSVALSQNRSFWKLQICPKASLSHQVTAPFEIHLIPPIQMGYPLVNIQKASYVSLVYSRFTHEVSPGRPSPVTESRTAPGIGSGNSCTSTHWAWPKSLESMGTMGRTMEEPWFCRAFPLNSQLSGVPGMILLFLRIKTWLKPDLGPKFPVTRGIACHS